LIIRNYIKKILARLAIRALRKYQTKLIVIYGWDFAEGLREGIYNLLDLKVNVRRNTEPITWDLGFPLAILGQNYSSNLSNLKLLIIIAKSYLRLLIAKKNSSYTIINLHAKTVETLKYWFSIEDIALLIIVPLKTTNIVSENLELSIGKKILKLDLRPEILINPGPSTKYNFPHLNSLQQQIANLVITLDKRIELIHGHKFNEDEIYQAITKIDWEKYLLAKIKNNLKEENR